MALKIGPTSTGPRWIIHRGASFTYGPVAVVDFDGAARSLVGCTVRLLIGRSLYKVPQFEANAGTGIVVTDAPNGELKVDLSAQQTGAFDEGGIAYELLIVDQAGAVILQLKGQGEIARTLTGNLGDEVIEQIPDGFADMVGDRPALVDAISETEDLLISDPERAPARLGRRKLKPLLDAKADADDMTAALAAKANASDVATALAGKADATATTTALALKAPLASPALTGTPTAPTPATSDNSTRIATTALVKAALAELVASSPAALDTLNELAAALGNDANFAASMTAALAAKQNSTFSANALAPGSVARGVAEDLRDLGHPLGRFGAKGDGVTDDRAAIQSAIDAGVPLIVPPGIYLCDGPVVLKRDTIIRGMGAPRANTTERRSTFKLADGANSSLVVTEYVSNGVKANNISVSGIMFDGNGANQTSEHTLVDWQGTYVQSRIHDCVFYNAFGPGLDLLNSFDVDLDMLHIIQCCSANYGMRINPGLSSIDGIVHCGQIYIENISEPAAGAFWNDPTTMRNDPTKRGRAMEVRYPGVLNIAVLHLEGVRLGLDLTNPRNLRLGSVNAIHVGCDTATDPTENALFRVNAMSSSQIDVGPCSAASIGGPLFRVLQATDAMVAGNTIQRSRPNRPIISGFRIGSGGSSEDALLVGNLAVQQRLSIDKVGSASRFGIDMYSNGREAAPSDVHYIDAGGDALEFGTTIGESASARTVWGRFRALGTSKRFELLAALVPPILAGTTGFVAWTIAIVNSVPQIRINSAQNNLVATRIGTAAPSVTPDYVGQRFLDATNKKDYVATGTSSSADWTIVN